MPHYITFDNAFIDKIAKNCPALVLLTYLNASNVNMYQLTVFSSVGLKIVLAFILENALRCKLATVTVSDESECSFVLEATHLFDALAVTIFCAENGINFA